jgi:hypothetical protein
MMLEKFGVTEANRRDALDRSIPSQAPKAPPRFAHSESPRYVGRAVAALAADPERNPWNQRSTSSGELARIYGFTDIDGFGRIPGSITDILNHNGAVPSDAGPSRSTLKVNCEVIGLT